MKMAPKRVSLLSVFFAIFLVCSTCTARDALYSGQTLFPGQFLIQGFFYVLTMQRDCNLVLYAFFRPVWASGTANQGVNCFATMQFDGNFVVYSGANVALWASGTNVGNGHYILSLQPDRNLVIYGSALWATGTNVATSGFRQLDINATAKEKGGKNDKP